MIVSLIYFIAGSLMQAFTFVFTLVNYFPPIASLTSSIGYFLGFTAYFYGVFDVIRFYTDASIAIGFEIFWFGFLIVWYVVGWFRSIISRGSSAH